MTHRMFTRSLFPVLLVGALLAGCSSNSSKSSGESTTTSSKGKAGALTCSKGDNAVKAALGSLPTVETTGLLGVESCEWNGDNVGAAVSTATMKVYGAALEAVEGGAKEPVSGIGDRAFSVKGYSSSTTAGTSGRTLWVVKGDQVYAVALKTGGAAPTNEQLVALAKPFVK